MKHVHESQLSEQVFAGEAQTVRRELFSPGLPIPTGGTGLA